MKNSQTLLSGGHSPSPRPSPAGRGRIFLSLTAKPSAEFAGRALENFVTSACCSLSLRVRVRVRVKAPKFHRVFKPRATIDTRCKFLNFSSCL